MNIEIRKYTLVDENQLFDLIEREGDEWVEYWQGENRAKYRKLLAECVNYLIFDGGTLCGYIRCRDDGGFGVYIFDLLVDKLYRGNGYGRLLMERVREDFPNDAVYVLGDVYPYYEGLGYKEEGKVYIVN